MACTTQGRQSWEMLQHPQAVSSWCSSSREDGRLLPIIYINPEKMVACRMSSIKHVKISEIHISEPRVNPSSYRIRSDPRDTPMRFPGPGADLLLPPGALGLLQVSTAAHEGSQAARDTLKASTVLVPHSPKR